MIIRSLQPCDAPALLTFELANRAWFEQHVAARAPWFYSAPGITAHLTEYLDLHDQGALLPCVLLDEHHSIVGRANLRHIDRVAGTGEVGYRIDQNAGGRGLGSRALRHLLDAARNDYRLHTIDAWITDQNPGSQRMVEKHGFVRLDLAPLPEICGAEQRWATAWRCALTPANHVAP